MLFLPHTVFLDSFFFFFIFKACLAFTYKTKKSLTQVNWVHRTALLGHKTTLLWRAKICRDKEMLDKTPGFFSSKQVSINLTTEKQTGTYFSSDTDELQKKPQICFI